MKKLVYIGLLFAWLASESVYSQDAQYTQLYASSIYLNPAFAGTNVCSRLTLTYRSQWPGITNAYKSYMVSMDHELSRKNVGLGLLVSHDVAGTGVLATDCFSPIFNYRIGINRKMELRLGLQPGLTMKSININNVTFGDQIYRGGNVSTIETIPNSRLFFDAGTGALLYAKNFWAGVSMFHFNRPNESLQRAAPAKLPVKYCVQGGYTFPLGEDQKTNYYNDAISLVFNYKSQAKFDQFDIGFYLRQHNIVMGLWYRGLPVKHYKPGYPNNDAVAAIIGVRTDRLNIGYSYDFTVSKLKTNTRGSHEITVGYQFCKVKPRKRRTVKVDCPKF